MKKLIIFDLDGTLLDSLEDLATAVNYALTQCKHPIHEVEKYKLMIGNGISKLLERALPELHKSNEDIERLRVHFMKYYGEHKSNLTTPYKGIKELLNELANSNIKLAVASNKFQSATEELVKHFFQDIKFEIILGQRENIPTKPDPQIIFEILDFTRYSKEETLFVGDSGVDIQTAKNAGVDVAAVSWGFKSANELRELSPNFLINSPHELIDIITK